MGQQSLTEGLQETLSVFKEAGEPLTTPEVADRLDLERRTAYARLERLVKQELIETKKVGASARVWWRPPTTTAEDRRGQNPQRREEKAFIENLLDAQPDLLYAFDTEGEILRWNDRFREVTGYTDAEIEQMHPVEFIADWAAEETMTAIEQVLEHGERVTVELPLVTADGEEIPYEFTGRPITDEAGEIIGLTGVGRDISDRKARERRLERQRDELRAELDDIFTRIDEAFFALDEDWRITYVNDRAAKLVRLPVGQLVGARVWDVLPEVAEGSPRERAERAVAIGESAEFEFYSEILDLWLEIRLYPSETGLSVYVRDITARKEREQQLERTLELLEQTERIANVGGWEVDPETMEVFRTDHLFEILEIPHEEGAPLDRALESYHEEDRPIVERAVERALDTGDPYDIEVRFCTPSGEVRWLRVQGVPETADGEVVSLRGAAQDITERKERERELEEYRRWNETLTENFPNGAVALVDEDLWYVTFGGTPEGDTDLTRAELEGAPVREVLPESLARTVVPGYEAALDGEPSEFEETIDGQTYQFHFVPVRDDDGDVFAAAAISQDVTERKERERELERQREQLAALNNLHDIVHDITDAVIEQSTREEIETIVCDRLATAPPYEFAWIGEIHPQTESIHPKVEAGVDGYAEAIPLSTDPDDSAGRGPAGEAVRTREMQITRDALTDPDFAPWREYAKTYGYRAAAAIPIVHEGTVYGVLGVYADRKGAFDGGEREVLAQLGEVIGHAIAAIERKRALTSDEITEIEFTAPDIPGILGFESDMEGTITFDRAVPIGDGEFLEYGTVDEERMAALEAFVENHPNLKDVEIIYRDDDTTRFKLRASDPPVVSTIASAGGYMEQVQIEDGDLYMKLHLPPTVAVRRIIDAVQEAFPTATLLTQRQITRAENGATRIQRTVTEDLTERQWTVLEAAVYSGFFKWPRDMAGEDIAESLGIAPSTFSQHLRKAQRKVFNSVFSSPARNTE